MLMTKNKTLRRIQGLLETFNLLFIKLLLRNRSRVSAFPGEMFRTYMSLAGKDKWMCKDILDVVPKTQEGCKIMVEHLPNSDRSLPLHELACLALITKVVNPKQVFEIGTYTGRTALNFAQNSPEDCIVWTLDSSPTEAYIRTAAVDDNVERCASASMDYRGKEAERKIRPLHGKSSVFDFSPYFGKIDIVFVNGQHHYEAVKSDTVNALRMVRPNGYVIWHDFANYGDCHDVTRAVINTLSGDNVVQISATQLALFIQPSEKVNSI